MKLRISLVHYLNAAPLGWSFLHGPLSGQFEVLHSSPAHCAEQLARGEADIGLIPSIEYQRIPSLLVIPGITLSAVSKVRSVLMVRRRGSGPIRSVALDTSSRTSEALLRLLLGQRMGLHPEFIPHPPDLNEMLSRCNAALIIGDAALKLLPEDYEIIDLAEAWIQWQQKPFVFAFWACRSDSGIRDELISIFGEARAWGLAMRREIAMSYAQRLSLPAQFLEEYLLHNIDYSMTPDHLDGLERFYQLACEARLVPELKPIRFL